MKQTVLRGTTATAAFALVFGLAACGAANEQPAAEGGTGAAAAAGASGTISGVGASSQAAAVAAWKAKFEGANPDATVNYDPQGSGAGRQQFLAGGVQFAGTDAYLDKDELGQVPAACGELIEFPAYISPIAIAYNLDGVDNLQLDPVTLAKIFDGKITTWNDPAIAADNPGVTLPATNITPVHRSDKSGTTENFTDYLNKAAPQEWTHEASGDWPVTGGEAGNGTTGVVQAITSGAGAIGYADASQIGSLHHAKIKVGDEYVAYTAEAAAKVVDASKRPEGHPEFSYAIDIQRDTKEAGAYPIVLVAYTEACTKYSDQSTADLVKAWLTYIVSEDGQQAAAEAAGSAPISATTRENAMKGINQISAGG
ncbi:phosphate transport system substrate-binding protein [Kineosphaera limosa]|uniref:Phosphate-binding protein n=1 Tax=Kineosphaera limosa NBRC 100340 TaxID=1184609 RepID=K6WPY4_9MICO|nr:phosphate ABC transporter substrate-binding protein PstS [Kineosphaera limosa]NYD99760.1 phosphate transport system substrate-binding protein [Kineosphaera limosa]GAB95861.1 phosphate ABC transporter substrate-binding protein [Kineosphaera limosa NBRC 100340]